MLNAAMVLMILAGLLGLPAVACSGFCSGIGHAAGAAQDPNASGGQAIMDFLLYAAGAAAIGSIVIGAMVKHVKKATAAISAFLFAGIFALLLIQLNFLGLFSSIMLVIAGVMICVAPAAQFRDQVNVRVQP